MVERLSDDRTIWPIIRALCGGQLMTEQKQRYGKSCPHDVHRRKGVGHKARWISTRVRMKCQQLYNLSVSNRLLPHGRAASFPATPPSLRASFEGLPYVPANKHESATPKTSCSNHLLCTLLLCRSLPWGGRKGKGVRLSLSLVLLGS